MSSHRLPLKLGFGFCLVAALATIYAFRQPQQESESFSRLAEFRAPAGNLPAQQHVIVDGFDAAVLPTGRLVTPVGEEISVGAPKAFGLDLSPDGNTLITSNDGIGPFSVTLIRNIRSGSPATTLVNLDATFMGVHFSHDGARYYASGGEDGLIWIGDTVTGNILGLVNLNGTTHSLTGPVVPAKPPTGYFKGTFPGNMALSDNGRYLYVVDQGAFQVDVVDTTKIDIAQHGIGATDPNNFSAVVERVAAGRYPFGIALGPKDKRLYVGNVGIFQYSHLSPQSPTGNSNNDYPIGYPAFGYPTESENSRTVTVQKVDPRNLPDTLSVPNAIQVGYVGQTTTYKVPGLGSPNAPPSSSLYIFQTGATNNTALSAPQLRTSLQPGPLVGQEERGLTTFGGSHPNAIVAGHDAIYVSVGNNDSISVLDPHSYAELRRINLHVLHGRDGVLKGVQPVALVLSPNEHFLYVAEAGINAIAVVDVFESEVVGHIPTGWWPSALRISADGKTLYVANARGRGAPANPPASPKESTIATVNIIPIPSEAQLDNDTERVLLNNGFTPAAAPASSDPIPNRAGVPSARIKHVIFITKENSTYDQLLGDILVTRKGTPVKGNPAYSLGYVASPNHHELALGFTFSDNFYLEPSVSSDGHRWLTNTYTTEFEETHWPASYGGRRNDAGDDPNVYGPYPGRLGFTDANGGSAPEDYNQHGSIFVHLARNGKSFVNFGEGYEFAEVDEQFGTEPTGIREHVNVPMEKALRDNSDHLYPSFNTHIPDAPLMEDPTRFSRFGRFRQVFESHYVNAAKDTCSLPSFTYLYYPNDHGGGANDINPNGPPWSYTRFVQDNDTALGQTVDLISHSPCWKDTAIFVAEDDTQNGEDHVNGGRSLFLAISPWVKHQYLSPEHFSLSSIFKTVDLILGIPPLNQYDLAATDLRDMFTATPDYTPYTVTTPQYAKGASRRWIELSKRIDFSGPDRDEEKLHAAILATEGLPHHR